VLRLNSIFLDYFYGEEKQIDVRNSINIEKLETFIGEDLQLRRSCRSLQYSHAKSVEHSIHNSETSEEEGNEAKILDVALPLIQ
jgi:hypothetical protein